MTVYGKGRKIYVRKPEAIEKNANNILIQKGAVPVDFNGNELAITYDTTLSNQISVVQEPSNDLESIDNRIRSVFNGRPLTTKELLTKLNLNWTAKKLNDYLKKSDFVENVKEKRTNLYKLKGETKQEIQGTLSF